MNNSHNICKARRLTLSLATVGICAATLECGKLALSAIPNVEIVTLLSALYGFCFGWLGVLSALIFVLIEPLIYGFGTWVISYIIHWPLVALLFMILRKTLLKETAKKRLIILPTALALITVIGFSLLTSLVDVGLFMGYFDNFISRFCIYYLRGIGFYLSQLLTNLIVFPTLFPILSNKLSYYSKKLKT